MGSKTVWDWENADILRTICERFVKDFAKDSGVLNAIKEVKYNNNIYYYSIFFIFSHRPRHILPSALFRAAGGCCETHGQHNVHNAQDHPRRTVSEPPGCSADRPAGTIRRACPTERSGRPDERFGPARRTLRASPADQSGRPESTNGQAPSPQSPRTKGRLGKPDGEIEKSLGADEKVLEAFQKVLWTNEKAFGAKTDCRKES